MFRKLGLGVSVLALLVTQTQAAVLQLEGLASVDSGKGFVPATNNMELSPGVRVRAGEGCALIVYHTGYESKVCNGQMAVVVSEPPSPVVAGPRVAPAVAEAPQADWLPAALVAAAGIGIGCAAGACESHNHQVSP